MLRKYFILIFFVFLISEIHAEYYKDEIKDFTIVKVRDGDTFIINIPNIPDVFGKYIAVRIRGIDTPELNDKREEIKAIAIKAKEELEKLLNSGKKIILYNLGRDKYFRLLASVKVDNVDVAEYMIKKVWLNLTMEALKRAGSQKSLVNINFILKINKIFHKLKSYRVKPNSFYYFLFINILKRTGIKPHPLLFIFITQYINIASPYEKNL